MLDVTRLGMGVNVQRYREIGPNGATLGTQCGLRDTRCAMWREKFTRLLHHLWCHCCRIEELLGDFERAELIDCKDSVVLHLRETWVQVGLLGSVERNK